MWIKCCTAWSAERESDFILPTLSNTAANAPIPTSTGHMCSDPRRRNSTQRKYESQRTFSTFTTFEWSWMSMKLCVYVTTVANSTQTHFPAPPNGCYICYEAFQFCGTNTTYFRLFYIFCDYITQKTLGTSMLHAGSALRSNRNCHSLPKRILLYFTVCFFFPPFLVFCTVKKFKMNWDSFWSLSVSVQQNYRTYHGCHLCLAVENSKVSNSFQMDITKMNE